MLPKTEGGKLAELSKNHTRMGDDMATEGWTERLEKMHSQLRKSQDELKAAQEDIQTKIGNLENLNFIDNDLNSEVERLSAQMDQERQSNSKLSADLAKSLELNLKLQFEIEEIRSKGNQALAEEKKHNQYLQEKNKSLTHEMELSQALCQDTRMELSKARDKFQADQATWQTEKSSLSEAINSTKTLAEETKKELEALRNDLGNKEEEITKISESLLHFESHSTQQHDLIKNLSSVAEKKIIELKVSLDKKAAEAADYYSHLQQSLNQVAVLRQENAALKEYLGKFTNL